MTSRKRTAKPAPYMRTVINEQGEKVRQQRTDATGQLGWRLRVTDPRSDRQPEQTFYGTYEDAVRELARIQADIDKRATGTVAHSKSLTFGEWVVDWLPAYAWKIPPSGAFAGVERRYSTWSKAKSLLEAQLLEAIGEDTRLARITRDYLVEKISGLTRLDGDGRPTTVPLKPSTLATCANVVRAIFRDAKAAGVITNNPAEGLPTVWGEEGTSRTALIPSLLEVEQLAAAMDETWRLPKWASDLYGPNGEGRGDLVRVLAFTGCRFAELAAVPVTMVSPRSRTMWVEPTATESGGRRQYRPGGKTKAATRPIILLDQAMDPIRRLNAIRKRGLELAPARAAAREARQLRPSQKSANPRTPQVPLWSLLISGEQGGFQSYGHWRKKLYVAQEKSGVDYDAHDLRHVAASLLYAAGEDARVIMTQMGHTSERTTERVYKHLFKLDHSEVAARISHKARAITDAEQRLADAELAAEDGAADGLPASSELDDDW